MLGDGFDIPAGAGTFDRIMVTAAMERIPEALTERLEPGGILIAPVGPHQAPRRCCLLDQDGRRQLCARIWSMSASYRRCPASPANCEVRIGCLANILFAGVKRLFTGEVFTQNSVLLRASE